MNVINHGVTTMTTVYRMENDEHFGPFSTMDAEEFAQHVSWAKFTKRWDGTPAIETSKTHPHHMIDIPNAEEVNYSDDPFALLFDTLPGLSNWHVAAKDLKQFYHWFPKDSLDYFASLGQHLAVYEVPDGSLMKGKYQVMFNQRSAKLVKVEDLKTIKE